MTNYLLFIGGIGAFELLVLIFPVIALGVLWILALADLLKSNFTDNTNKLVWALVIIFVPVFGAILYFAMGRKQKVKSI